MGAGGQRGGPGLLPGVRAGPRPSERRPCEFPPAPVGAADGAPQPRRAPPGRGDACRHLPPPPGAAARGLGHRRPAAARTVRPGQRAPCCWCVPALRARPALRLAAADRRRPGPRRLVRPLRGPAAGRWPWLLLAVALVRARRRAALAVLAGVVALAARAAADLAAAATSSPTDRPVAGPDLHPAQPQHLQGRGRPGAGAGRGRPADVVVLVEATAELVRRAGRAGWRDRFPYDAGASGATSTNTVVFSRFPLSGSRQFGSGSFDQWVTDRRGARARAGRPRRGAPLQPVLRQRPLGRRARGAPRAPSSRTWAGRWSSPGTSTPSSTTARCSSCAGWACASAADLVGTGWAPTYPANRALPPLLAIDHVLVDPALSVAALERVPVAGTDHLGLLATIGGLGLSRPPGPRRRTGQAGDDADQLRRPDDDLGHRAAGQRPDDALLGQRRAPAARPR